MKVRALIGRIAAVVVVLALAGGGVYLFMTQPAKAPVAAQAPPPPQVGVVELAAADVPLPLEFSGRVAGFRVVEIRAQVSGILLKREYLEGAVVDVGQVLFRIDPRTYEAALARASAQAAQARAALIQAEENYKRQEGLAAQKVATQKSLEDAIAARDQARAAIQSTEADVQTAKLNLEFTVIKAPVKGPTSLVSPAEGTLIKAQDTLLTTITQLDPAYVNFTFTDSELRSLQEIDRSSEELFDPAHVKVELQFGDGATYPEPGTVDTRSRTIDPRTGTILTRAIFPNHDGRPAAGPVRAREDDRHHHAQRHRGAQGRDLAGAARALRLRRRAGFGGAGAAGPAVPRAARTAGSCARACRRATASWSTASSASGRATSSSRSPSRHLPPAPTAGTGQPAGNKP